MYAVVNLCGSPAPTSRTHALLSQATHLLSQQGIETRLFTIRDLSPEDLVYGNFESDALKTIQLAIEASKAVIVATPVYKATYTGVLKALLDLLPQYAFADKIILPMAVGGTINHLLAIDYGMKPLFSVMGAAHILKGVYAVNSQIQFTPEGAIQLEAELEERLVQAIQELIDSLTLKHKPFS
ncbi:MAG: NADPH-dependent FMN reductase [Cyanobacteriota bacterium]|nr:NADPH-dependent FMN reductase [Cyanobacteriota bacterium]